MSELTEEGRSERFDLKKIRKRMMIRSRYHSWSEARNGLIAEADGRQIRVLFQPHMTESAAYYLIRLEEYLEKKWEIRITEDMEEILSNVEEESGEELEATISVEKLLEMTSECGEF